MDYSRKRITLFDFCLETKEIITEHSELLIEFIYDISTEIENKYYISMRSYWKQLFPLYII